MSAATKRTVLAAASVTVLVVSVVAPAGSGAAPDRDRTAPTTPLNMRVTAATPSLVSVTWDPSLDDVGVAGYYVFGDKGKATVGTPAYVAQGLECGKTTLLSVIAFDEAQNRSERATLTVATAACPDAEAPTAPSGFTQLATSQNAVVLGWSPSSDNVGVVEYGVYRDLVRVVSAEPDVALGGLACGSTYAYAVDAADAAGNRSPRSNVFVRTASCPTTPPSGDATPPSAPSGLAASSVTQTSLALTWTAASDNVGVVGYDVSRNGSKVASPTTTSVSQSDLACGTSYAFAVAARDTAGNTSAPAQLSVTTSACAVPSPGDSTPPSAPSGLGISGVTSTSVSLTWTASRDNVGVAGYRLYVNGAYASTTAQLGATVSSLTCGTTYLFEVDAVDVEGNNSTRASVTGSPEACVDTQAPSAPLTVAATSRTATSIALAWNPSSDNVGVTAYGLYRAGSQVGTTSSTNAIFSGLVCNTNYTLAIDAYDAAGNRSAQTTVMVATTACPDTTPPSVPTGLSTSNVSQTGLTLNWNASTDNVGVTGYDVYRNGTKMATVTSTSSSQAGLACGTSYLLAVEGFDAAGNRSMRAQLSAATAACSAPSPPSIPSTALGSALPARLPESTGATFYVSLSGNDANPGTQAQPWRTIQKAANTLTAGQRALVAAGSYSGGEISVTRNLAGPQPATIEALDPASKPVIMGSMRLQNAGTAPAAYWRFRNLKVDGTGSGIEYGIKITNDGSANVPHHLEFFGMEIYNVNTNTLPQGMLISGGTGSSVPSRIDVYNTLVHDIGPGSSPNQSHSFYIASCEVCVFANNVSRDMTGYAIHANGGSTSKQGMRNSFVANNTIVRHSVTGAIALFSASTGTPSDYMHGGNRIYNNIVVDVVSRAYGSIFDESNNGPASPLNLWDKNLAFNYGTLYQNVAGADVSSTFVSQPLNADPKFVNKAGNDFHLLAGSPAIGAGLSDYTPAFDFDGDARTTADLGAFGA